MEVEPPHLQNLAIQLFSICPNSASCERGFSICGWLSNKRRLKLGVERLESMLKLITYYRSNISRELGFYGKGHKNSEKLSEEDLNAIINEAIAEPPDDDDDDNNEEITTEETRKTTDGYVIPDNEVVIWIENILDLHHSEILEGLEIVENEFPEDDDNDLNLKEIDNEVEIEEEERIIGKGVMEYNVEDFCNEFAIE